MYQAHRVFSSTVIEHVIARCETDPSSAVAFFYFDFRDEAKLNLKGLLSSLTSQMLEKCATIPAAITSLFSQCSNGMRTASISDLDGVLFELLRRFEHSYVIVDALDEPPYDPQRKAILPFIRSLVREEYSGLHFMVTSRKERDIQAFFESIDHVPIDISTGLIEDDISMYIRDVLEQDPELKQWGTRVHNKIEYSLTERANGM